ncbi:protein of unknown function DUF323 [Isosphaera pallida ATCC 43644]|jgi:formylglycine-generating enzyme required for sulfatase activity|uniref:Sulfatase-modifying factor enzyme-like domain-containing protein n=1 Tax=Isosphaera pallida (strain ATCC 43644 / DSM 9630 / IS1B) TaxID=575540 RepID=E8QWB8_ISOPI|nr:formylglycine-generating enzyme family protein [Isosphaera pallida]ADV60805.1 protein of unknown function DUF323 [Isosphaera pallida ATCC 43644]
MNPIDSPPIASAAALSDGGESNRNRSASLLTVPTRRVLILVASGLFCLWAWEGLSRRTFSKPAVAHRESQSWEGREAGELKVVTYKDQELRFRWCPPGSFTMGSPPTQPDRFDNEGPVEVRLTRGFWMLEVEVTQGLWRAANGPKLDWERKGAGPLLPVYNVSHSEAAAFAASLTTQLRRGSELPPGWKVSLPTEAQWEYAARAGTTTRFPFGDDESQLGEYAWYAGNSNRMPRNVGTRRANAWGLKDMLGNVWEWCLDGYAEALPGGKDPIGDLELPARVNRGGSWTDEALYCRPTARVGDVPTYRNTGLGFRLTLVPDQN